MEQENIKTKICSKCKLEKNVNEFTKDKYNQDGYDIRCRMCKTFLRKKWDIDYRKNNREIIFLKNKEYKENNREIVLEQRKKSYLKNFFKIKKRIAKKKQEKPEYFLYYSAKYRAKKYNIPFNLKISDIKIPLFCPILGIPLVLNNNKSFCDNSPTLDKIIPELGYISENIRVISWRANHLKNDISFYELEKIIKDYQNLLKIHQEETNILEINNA